MYDVVIVGSGLAACTTALSIEKTKKILMLTKGEINACNSYHAQGGIAVTMNPDLVDINSHIDDTYKTGANYGNIESISELVCKSKIAIEFLEANNIQFDGTTTEKYHFTREGGHTKHRILHAGGDKSGQMIMDGLVSSVLASGNIDVKEHAQALYFENDKLYFAKNNQLHSIASDAFVLALGGIGSSFLTTTSVKENRGDFITIAKSANLEIENLHFQQFHPTAFYSKNANEIFLLSEALRGEGAVLLNSKGENFMSNYHEMGNLAPRDVVSRAILSETKRLGDDNVYLDFRMKSADFLSRRFPLVYNYCQNVGYNLATDLIPVFPAAHYTIGGIKSNLNGQTSRSNIYACGECASTGVHGANRLASNSLLECVVMGINVGFQINSQKTRVFTTNTVQSLQKGYKFDELSLRNRYNQTLSVKRDYQEILELEQELTSLVDQLVTNKVADLNWFDHYNQLQIGLEMIKSIKKHPDSIGCHYMEGK